MKIKLCLFYFFLFKGILVFGQAPEIEWEKSFGGNGGDRGQAIISTPDSGFIAVGYTNSTDGDIILNHGSQDFWIVKMDSDGEMLWQKSYGGSAYDLCYGICNGVNGGFILVGQTNSIDGDVTENKGLYDYWIIKIDDNGEIVWQKTFGGTSSENARSIIPTNDGNYLIAGYTSSNDGDISSNQGSSDVWIVKLNDFGSIIWQKTFGSSESDHAYDIVETIFGEIYVCGYSEGSNGDVSNNNGSTDFWILKLNAEGNLIWEKSFGGSESDNAQALCLKENGVVCVGETYSNDYDVDGFHGLLDTWVVAVDSLGNLQWQRPYGGTNGDEGDDIAQLSNNDFIFTGRSSVANGDVTENKGAIDYWVVSIDSLGVINWQKSIGGSDEDHSYGIAITADSQIVVNGVSESSDFDVTATFTFENYWVVKLAKCEMVYYLDFDNDGYGNSSIDTVACDIPLGYSIDPNDCNDFNLLIHPLAVEICNGLDDNCDGNIDEDIFYYTYFEDADNDDYGNINSDSIACALPAGYVESNTDCDDTNPSIYPGAPEILNGLDDNCDGFIDEGLEIDNALLSAIKIYPNPASDQLFIETSLQDDFNIEIFDARGRIIFNLKFNSNTNISLIDFSQGIYFIKIISENSFAGINFIKE